MVRESFAAKTEICSRGASRTKVAEKNFKWIGWEMDGSMMDRL